MRQSVTNGAYQTHIEPNKATWMTKKLTWIALVFQEKTLMGSLLGEVGER